ITETAKKRATPNVIIRVELEPAEPSGSYTGFACSTPGARTVSDMGGTGSGSSGTWDRRTPIRASAKSSISFALSGRADLVEVGRTEMRVPHLGHRVGRPTQSSGAFTAKPHSPQEKRIKALPLPSLWMTGAGTTQSDIIICRTVVVQLGREK